MVNFLANLLAWFTVVGIWLALTAIFSVIGGFVFQFAWNHFVVLLCPHAPVLEFWQAFAGSLLVNILRGISASVKSN